MKRYRVKAEHPRRGGPLRISDKSGAVIAASGDVCDGIADDLVASMLAQGFLEPLIDDEGKTPARPARKAGR